MKRFLRSGDRKWLQADRPFGPLHGGIVLSDGKVIWRGAQDDIDPDEWLDMVENESLARLLDSSDRILSDQTKASDVRRQFSWDILETIPEEHDFHVEVLRRRLQLIYGNEEFKELHKAVQLSLIHI